MAKFGRGKHAYAISDRSGFRYLYRDMRKEWNGLLVGPDEYEPKQPQLGPFRTVSDAQALKDAGVSDYSIWLDPQSNHLFGILTRADNHTLDTLPDTEIMKRWWAHMADVMETNEENVPTQIPLKRVFFLP